MKQKHTPGPWKTERWENGLQVIAANGMIITQRNSRVRGPEEDANARLIAACPDLLTSLKEIRDATAFLMRAIHKAGFINEVMELIDHKADGFGARANKAIAEAEEEEK